MRGLYGGEGLQELMSFIGTGLSGPGRDLLIDGKDVGRAGATLTDGVAPFVET